MTKETRVSGGAYAIQESQIKHLEGRLLTLVESSLPTEQAVAMKSLVSQEVWNGTYILGNTK